MAATLYTIGYEKARLPDVIAALGAAGVATLIDVRDRPQSRRPGFSKRQLEAGLEEAGIRYVHLRALGTPPEGREANKRRQWDRFWHIVETKLATGEAELALQQAADIAGTSADLPALPGSRLATLPPPPRRRNPDATPRLHGAAPVSSVIKFRRTLPMENGLSPRPSRRLVDGRAKPGHKREGSLRFAAKWRCGI